MSANGFNKLDVENFDRHFKENNFIGDGNDLLTNVVVITNVQIGDKYFIGYFIKSPEITFLRFRKDQAWYKHRVCKWPYQGMDEKPEYGKYDIYMNPHIYDYDYETETYGVDKDREYLKLNIKNAYRPHHHPLCTCGNFIELGEKK
jgi:hypothetical protein